MSPPSSAVAIVALALGAPLSAAPAAASAPSSSSSSSAPAAESLSDFDRWAAERGRRFGDDAALRAAEARFEANRAVIDALNADGEDGAEYGHTIFSDWSPEEFARRHFPKAMDAAEGRHGGAEVDEVELLRLLGGGEAPPPAAFDWRDEGAVTPVRDQTSCGSCWAESAVSNMESMWFLSRRSSMKAPVPLSVQQVIECDAHDYACYGGFPKGAYQYAIEHGGLTSEAAYPYSVDGHTVCLANQTYNETCGDGICDDPPLTNYCDERCSDGAPTHQSVATFSKWVALPADEVAMAAFVANTGPLSVGLDASGGIVGILFPWLQFYKRGVANPSRCTTKIDHSVVVVGFGEEKGTKYCTIKNSWGEKWGERGYFRLVRGAGKCGIATMATTSVAATTALASAGEAAGAQLLVV